MKKLKIIFTGDTVAGSPVIRKIKEKSELVALAGLSESRHIEKNIYNCDVQTLNSEETLFEFKRLEPDLIINFNSTVLFSKELLEIPGIASLNFHPGPLPEYAGLFVYQWAIINGENEYGVTIHSMEETIDTGLILAEDRFPVSEKDTGLSLYMKTLNKGCDLIGSLIDRIAETGKLEGKKQDLSKRGYYSKNKLKNGKVNFNQNTRDVYNFIRALTYKPFNSPTCVPEIKIKESILEIGKAEIMDLSPQTPGSILNIDDSSILISTQDGSIKVKGLYKNGEKIKSFTEFADINNIIIGNRIES